MRYAGLELRCLLLAGRAADLPATLGPPAAECLIAVLANDRPLSQWAAQGWLGRAINKDTASGILIGALGALAHGNARLLLDAALGKRCERRR